jgi:DNA-directed RNA polymerase subunit RPC12/RpoP
MQLRCYRCGMSFSLNRYEAAFALEALEETGGKHHDARCPRCRHSNRVSLEQLRRLVPRPAPEAAAPAVESPPSGEMAEEKPDPKESTDDKPKVVKPEAKKPATKKPAAKKPAAKKPAAAKKPTAKKSGSKKPAAKKPASKQSASKKAKG